MVDIQTLNQSGQTFLTKDEQKVLQFFVNNPEYKGPMYKIAQRKEFKNQNVMTNIASLYTKDILNREDENYYLNPEFNLMPSI